jgi:alkylation response protein AidB-like acyl-CoA dehydrogenase
MDFDLTEEQSMLAASCERLVRERCGFEARRTQAREDARVRPPLWPELTELGLTALTVPESAGGLGRPLLDGVLVAQVLGRGWLLEPFVDCALAAARTLAFAPASSTRDAALAALASGQKITVPLNNARRSDGLLIGQAPHAGHAHAFLWLLDDRLMLALASNYSRRAWRQFDGTPAAEVQCPESSAILLAEGEPAHIAWEAGQIAAHIGRIAEGVGLAKAVLDVTAEYLRTRKQFGQPIGRFQALAHRMADLLILYEQAQSLMLAAAMKADGADSARTMDAAQVMAHRTFRTIGQQAIQLHGGIGMTDEYAVSHYVKRLLAIEIELGDADTALARFAAAA